VAPSYLTDYVDTDMQTQVLWYESLRIGMKWWRNPQAGDATVGICTI
jgi:hypothetical protein